MDTFDRFRLSRKCSFDGRQKRGWSDGQPGPNKGCSKGKRGWKWVVNIKFENLNLILNGSESSKQLYPFCSQ